MLQHLYTFVGKRREGCKPTTHARSQEQIQRVVRGTVLAEYRIQNPEEEATQQIDSQCTPWKSLSTYILHAGGEQIPHGTPDEASCTNNQ